MGTATTNYFRDTGLSPNTSYSYTVAAVDPEGHESVQSIQRLGYSSGIYTNPIGGNVSMSIVDSPVIVAPGGPIHVSWQMILNPPGSAGHHDAHFNTSLDSFGCNPPICWYSLVTGSNGNTFWTDTTAPSTTRDIWYMPGPHPNSPSTYYNDQHHHYPLQRIVITNGNPLAITIFSLPNATPNTPYSQTITHNNSSEATGPFSCGVSDGRLPNNLSLNSSTCEISGIPTELGTFTFTVRVKATSENYAIQSLTLTVGNGTGDTQAPSIPTGISATVISSFQISLSWSASTDNVGVTGYLVERCQGADCTNFTLIASATTTNFSNTGLTPNTSYTYRVRATDASGITSAPSNPASATTLAADNNNGGGGGGGGGGNPGDGNNGGGGGGGCGSIKPMDPQPPHPLQIALGLVLLFCPIVVVLLRRCRKAIQTAGIA